MVASLQPRTYRLVPWVIRALIPHHLPGTYTLFNTTGTIYTGRSDTDLRRRLVEHARTGRAEYFDFDPHRSVGAAYLTECASYHALGTGLQNAIHPAAPRGTTETCPFCRLAALDTIAARLRPGTPC